MVEPNPRALIGMPNEGFIEIFKFCDGEQDSIGGEGRTSRETRHEPQIYLWLDLWLF